MTLDPHRAVRDQQPVAAHYRNTSKPHAYGRVIAYCDAPTYIIETPDGTRFSWRADLTKPVHASQLPTPPQPAPPAPLLTKPEIDVLYHVADGLTNPQIARAMYLSASTIQTHLRRIAEKLGTSSRFQSVVAAHARRYINISYLDAA